MVGTKRSFKTISVWLAEVSFAMLMILAVGCGGGGKTSETGSDDPSQSASLLDSANVEDSVDVELNGSLTLHDMVVPVIEPESGSPESKILSVFRRGVEALNAEDWDAYLATCDPRLAKPFTPDQVEFTWVTNVVPFAPAGTANYRNATFRVFDDGTAMSEADGYSNDTPWFEDLSEAFALVDGKWFSNSIFCHGGNSRKVEQVDWRSAASSNL